jgi:hypothetical protein
MSQRDDIAKTGVERAIEMNEATPVWIYCNPQN